MDPVTVLGLVASIVQLIDATSKVIKYINEVKDTPKERETLAQEAANLMPLLMTLKQRASSSDESWFSAVRLLGVPEGPVPQLQTAMEQMGTTLKKRRKRRGGDLLWPSDEKECIVILSKIERMKSLIALALQDDHFKLSLALKKDFSVMYENVETVSQKVSQLDMNQQSNQTREILDWLFKHLADNRTRSSSR